MFRRLSDEQQEAIEALHANKYKVMRPSNQAGTTYQTLNGYEVQVLHGLGDGKTVKLDGVKQPSWYARMVRRALGL